MKNISKKLNYDMSQVRNHANNLISHNITIGPFFYTSLINLNEVHRLTSNINA